MKDPALRFWAVEHVAAMFGAVVLAHVGRVLARKATTPAPSARGCSICFGLATVLMLLGMPWPGHAGGRPLFRVYDSTILSSLFSSWASEVGALVLARARVRRRDHRSVGPAFRLVFVSAGAVAAAAAALLGFGVPVQIGTFVVVMTVSLVALRSRLLGGSAARRAVAHRAARSAATGIVTHDIDPTVGTGRVNVGGEDWAARSTEPIAAGTQSPGRRRRRHRAGGHARMIDSIVLLRPRALPARSS